MLIKLPKAGCVDVCDDQATEQPYIHQFQQSQQLVTELANRQDQPHQQQQQQQHVFKWSAFGFWYLKCSLSHSLVASSLGVFVCVFDKLINIDRL